MKTFSSLGPVLTILIGMSVAPSYSPVMAQQANLIASVYPGAVPVPLEDHNDLRSRWRLVDAGHALTDQTRSFLSRDPLDKVRAYYDKEVGAMQNASLTYLRVPEGMRSETMKPKPYIFAHALGQNDDTELIGVELRALEPREERAPTNYDAVGPIFKKLLMGQAAGEATKHQFDAAVEDHKHLSWMFYPLSDEQDGRGRRLTMDEVVFNECEKGAGGGLSRQELQAKMQQLMAEGKMREMQQLAQQASGASGMGSWDAWMDCLKKLEERGYRTLITIYLQP